MDQRGYKIVHYLYKCEIGINFIGTTQNWKFMEKNSPTYFDQWISLCNLKQNTHFQNPSIPHSTPCSHQLQQQIIQAICVPLEPPLDHSNHKNHTKSKTIYNFISKYIYDSPSTSTFSVELCVVNSIDESRVQCNPNQLIITQVHLYPLH